MKLREGLVLRVVGTDHVIVDPGQGVVDLSRVFTLNETAAYLWEKLEGKDFEAEDMIECLKESYDFEDVDMESVKKEMNDLILFFEQNDLLAK